MATSAPDVPPQFHPDGRTQPRRTGCDKEEEALSLLRQPWYVSPRMSEKGETNLIHSAQCDPEIAHFVSSLAELSHVCMRCSHALHIFWKPHIESDIVLAFSTQYTKILTLSRVHMEREGRGKEGGKEVGKEGRKEGECRADFRAEWRLRSRSSLPPSVSASLPPSLAALDIPAIWNRRGEKRKSSERHI